ncbi:MAG: glycosyltransferase [bacterium]
MLSLLWLEQQFGVAVFLLVLVAIALWNRRVLRRPIEAKPPAHRPRVSVLLPARDEERNIVAVVESLAGQDYPDYELLVLDDGSTDRTPELLRELAVRFPRIRVLAGEPLSPGWLGKHWACHQLAGAASGELLLFTDADTRHRPEALRRAVAEMESGQLDLVSGVPREEVVSWAEKLIVPILPWAINSFLPLGLAYRLHRPAFTAANGQYLLFRRSSYARLGGHERVRNNVVDDLALVRLAARHRMRWRVFDLTELVNCRMYHSAREVFEGFGKNLYGAFGYRPLPFLFVWLWLGVVTFQPLVVLGHWAAGATTSPVSAGTALAAVLLMLALWGLCHAKFRFPLYLAFGYPLSVALGIVIAIRSMRAAYTGRARWKGRALPARQGR